MNRFVHRVFILKIVNSNSCLNFFLCYTLFFLFFVVVLQKFPSGLVRVTESCVNLVFVSKNGYHNVDVMYSVGPDDCLVLRDGWKELVEESGLQYGDVVMAMFYRHANCLEIKLNLL